MRCRHVLVKHENSRRPSSHKSKVITRSEDEAYSTIKRFRRELLEAKDVQRAFEDLAKAESDCGSYKKGGDLGHFVRGKMQKSFEEAAFGLEVGSLSQPVSTQSGLHIILRIE